MMMCHFRTQNTPICHEQFFLVQTIIITFIYLLPIFIGQNLKKILTADPELWGCTLFGPKIVHLPQRFFWKIINITLIYLLAPFIVQNLKNNLPADPELWGCAIFGPKMAYFPKWEFFQKPVNKPCFFHSCLSTCQKSKSDIYLLMEYWRLKNTEISLAENNFWL